MTGPVVVCGAGAAGLVAAIFAARGGARVIVLESTADGGRKILISGGGRCNVLPASLDDRRFVTDSSPHSLRKIVRAWPLAEQRAFFERDLGVPLQHEPATDKLFPVSGRARDVRDALVAAARSAGAELHGHWRVDAIVAHGDAWRIHGRDREPIDANAVVVATGGLSVPQTGSDGTGLRLIEQLGHRVHDPYPALTPLLQQPPRYADLAGVSRAVALRATTANGVATARGGFLFTHRGFSGPAVLDLSHLAVRAGRAGTRQEIFVSWTDRDADAWDATLRASRGTVASVLRPELENRLAERLLEDVAIAPDQRLAELGRDARQRLVEALTRWPLPWTADAGYRKAEVTGGGVALGEVDPRSLESRRRSGLFLCGEILDAFGPIGGYNFAWAWATGRAAGLGAAARGQLAGAGRQRS